MRVHAGDETTQTREEKRRQNKMKQELTPLYLTFALLQRLL
jgi:hypothetical protein